VGKLLGVAAFAGGLATVLLGVFLTASPTAPAGWRQEAELISRIYMRLIVPGLVVAATFGMLLAASIWRVMVRMRWFVVKMALVVVAVPALHVFMRSRLTALHALLAEPIPDLGDAAALRGQLLLGTSVAIAFAVATIILGRVKPRLGQDYGRTFSRAPQSEG
jgi:hypothetical protein